MNYAEACPNELARPISTLLRLRATVSFRRNIAAEASRWQHCVRFDQLRDLNFTPPVPRMNALQLDEVAGALNFWHLLLNMV